MDDTKPRFTGGCLCGALRWEADADPTYMGHCYCADCRKASGSGFIPFMSFRAESIRFSGPARQFASPAASGRKEVRNFCPICGSLVFGGEVGKTGSFTIYAGHGALRRLAMTRVGFMLLASDLGPITGRAVDLDG